MKIYNIDPVAKPRMSKQDNWPIRPPKYKGKEWPRTVVVNWRRFENQVIAEKVELPEDGAHVIFALPMPRSWSGKKKKEMYKKRHKQVPDLDNLLKALGDAVYGNDCVISDIRATKIWAHAGYVQIFERMCFF